MSLADELVELADHLDVPAGDALVVRVGAAVRTQRRRSVRRRLVLVLAVLVVLVLVASLVPAVGEWLGVRGVEVHQGPPASTSVPATVPGVPELGVRSTLSAAGRAAGFDVLVPDGLGPPDAVWLETRTAVPVVTLAYPGERLVSELRARPSDGVVLHKFASGVGEIDVDGHRAVWLEGVHDVLGIGLRRANSALLMELGELTVRIETPAGRDDAVAIARNLVRAAGVEAP